MRAPGNAARPQAQGRLGCVLLWLSPAERRPQGRGWLFRGLRGFVSSWWDAFHYPNLPLLVQAFLHGDKGIRQVWDEIQETLQVLGI